MFAGAGKWTNRTVDNGKTNGRTIASHCHASRPASFESAISPARKSPPSSSNRGRESERAGRVVATASLVFCAGVAGAAGSSHERLRKACCPCPADAGNNAAAMRAIRNLEIVVASRTPSASPFVDRQEAVIERQGQQRQRRAELGAELPLEAAVGLLRLLELADQQLVPLLPGLDVALEQRLGLVVARVFEVAGPGRLLERSA